MQDLTWMNWCRKQMGDFSRKLMSQGFYPAQLEYLTQTFPDFREKLQSFIERTGVIMEEMAQRPTDLTLYEAFTKSKMEFLHYTNAHRAEFLGLGLAETA